MTEEKPRAWVGDQVYDADAGKEGIVSDVERDGTYILREVNSFAQRWKAPSAEKLTVTVSRLGRVKKERADSGRLSARTVGSGEDVRS